MDPAIVHAVQRLVEALALGIELLAVGLVVIPVVYASAAFATALVTRRDAAGRYARYKSRLARALLLGLEVLVAADIVRTVAVDPTVRNGLTLGLLVLIRTFLSWSLVVELEGRWPWQGREK